MIDLRKGDGIVTQSGSRLIVESEPFNRGCPLFDDWRVPAWTEDREYRFPIQVIAVVEVWRNGRRVDDAPQQISMFGDYTA